jgi:hypothetical protein
MFSPWRFSKWIPSIVPTLFSYHIGSHSNPNYMCFLRSLALNHDQAFRWNLSHCNGESLYQVTSCILCLQFRKVFTTHFSPHQFKVATKGGCNLRHQVHLGPSPPSGCYLVGCGKCLQFSVKRGHISRTSCSKWHSYHWSPFNCIIYIWTFPK